MADRGRCGLNSAVDDWLTGKSESHTCRISRLITSRSDSRPRLATSQDALPAQGSASCYLAKVSWRKWYHRARRFMRDSLPFASLFTEYIDSHRRAASTSSFPPGGFRRAGAHLLGVAESASPVARLLWQVLIENQTQAAAGPNLQSCLWLPF